MTIYTLRCISTAIAPLTHMAGTAGNIAMLAREPVETEYGEIWVPFLSGNALRHRLVREPGMMWLINRYGLCGELSLPQLNFLLHGGNLTQSTARENTRRIAKMKRTWPLLRLLGGALPDQILSGSLDVWRGVLVCRENRQYLAPFDDVLPNGTLLSAETWVGEYQYTRSDAIKHGIHRVGGSEDWEKELNSNLMIYSGQCVHKGAVFAHGFVLKHVSELELGALLWSLRLWQHTGGTIGGMASRGHGRLLSTIIDTNGLDQDRLCQEYVNYAISVKDDAIAWLEETFE